MGADGCSGIQLRIGERKRSRDDHGCQLWAETGHDRTGQTGRKSVWESEG